MLRVPLWRVCSPAPRAADKREPLQKLPAALCTLKLRTERRKLNYELFTLQYAERAAQKASEEQRANYNSLKEDITVLKARAPSVSSIYAT